MTADSRELAGLSILPAFGVIAPDALSEADYASALLL